MGKKTEAIIGNKSIMTAIIKYSLGCAGKENYLLATELMQTVVVSEGSDLNRLTHMGVVRI